MVAWQGRTGCITRDNIIAIKLLELVSFIFLNRVTAFLAAGLCCAAKRSMRTGNKFFFKLSLFFSVKEVQHFMICLLRQNFSDSSKLCKAFT